MKRVLWAALLALFLSGTTNAQTSEAGTRWLDISMGGPLVDWFNETASPQDIARLENTAEIDRLLPVIHVGRKLVVFKSIEEAKQLLPDIAEEIDIIGYNLEHGPVNRPEEQAAPVESVARMRALADQYGLLLAVGPDHDFTISHGAEMAPYADIYVLQIQRQQTQPRTVRDYVSTSGAALLTANPDLELSVQVRAEGAPEELAALVTSLQPSPNGVSILTSPESVATTHALADALRRLPPLPAERSTAIPSIISETAPISAAHGVRLWLYVTLAALLGTLMLVQWWRSRATGG